MKKIPIFSNRLDLKVLKVTYQDIRLFIMVCNLNTCTVNPHIIQSQHSEESSEYIYHHPYQKSKTKSIQKYQKNQKGKNNKTQK